jgi:putative transcriptional regulator
MWRDGMVQTALTNKIRKLRFEHGEMTQKQLAELTGCTRQTINAIEAAKYAPSLELAFKIAQVFGLKVDDVFFYADERDG